MEIQHSAVGEKPVCADLGLLCSLGRSAVKTAGSCILHSDSVDNEVLHDAVRKVKSCNINLNYSSWQSDRHMQNDSGCLCRAVELKCFSSADLLLLF